jgi:hypothetical protein
MIVAKVYKYDSNQQGNDYKGEDYSKYAKLGYSSIDNLEDTLDTFSICLAGLPFREEFAPKTKFIIELYDEDVDATTGERTLDLWDEPLHLEVDNDAVEQPILSNNNYFNHNITFIEPSVDTQSRLVDNIAVTYKLQDVTLNEQPTYDVSLLTNFNFVNTPTTSSEFLREPDSFLPNTKKYMIQGHRFEWVFPDWYTVNIDGQDITPKDWWETNSLKFFQPIDITETSKTMSFPVPMLKCSSAVKNSYSYAKNGYCSVNLTITDKNLSTGEQTQTTFRINPYTGYEEENWTKDNFDADARNAGSVAPTNYGWIVSRWVARKEVKDGRFYAYKSKVAERSSTLENRVINLEIFPNHSYSITMSLRNFNLSSASDSGMTGNATVNLFSKDEDIDNIPAYYSYARTYAKYTINWKYSNEAQYTNSALPSATLNFQGVSSAGQGKIIFASAPPASAYDLFNKAQLCTQSFMKEPNIIVDETNKQIVLKQEDEQLLKDTTIIESFYNQKNLWEVLLDIGKYIHARPKLRFTENNKYLVTWKKYGRTDKLEDKGNAISIYNSRFVEDYVCSVSSYVANMVQLGGTIREVVAPKSSSEDYLVYNDVAEIKTSKNIIEIVDMSVININTGERRGLTGKDPNVQLVQVNSEGQVSPLGIQNTTGFVFEEGVYKLLDVSPNTSINKGYAIYYTLGTNIIKGFNYQLPTVNTGGILNNYAIKNIIGCAFGLSTYREWVELKVNDYLFDITYRTKDTLRTDQARPDLRKYMLSTPYDMVPQHNQFANQTDVVVDSIKYGNNVYGMLIRTGNATYTKTEWVKDLASLKKSGELYDINGEWYYVSKCQNTYYADHIISQVDFSKDFNKLSQIIGIPSEPRFYEISEQSLIKREVAINDYVVIGTNIVKRDSNDISFLQGKSADYIAGLLFDPVNNLYFEEGDSREVKFPRYVVTTLKNDLDKVAQQNTDILNLSVLLPASTYSLENTLTIEWDMLDNFSAGEKVVPTESSIDGMRDKAYNLLEMVRYCDRYGRVDMFNFAILEDYNLSPSEVQNLPVNPIDIYSNSDKLLFGDQNSDFYFEENEDTNKGIVLLKDNREQLCFNYNLQALTDSDRFVLSSYLWQQGKKNLRLAVLGKEVNKISNATIEENMIVKGDIPFWYSVDEENKTIAVHIDTSLSLGDVTSQQLAEAKAIAIYSTDFINDSALSSSKYFVIARNISGLTLDERKKDWCISPYSKSIFKKQ